MRIRLTVRNPHDIIPTIPMGIIVIKLKAGKKNVSNSIKPMSMFYIK